MIRNPSVKIMHDDFESYVRRLAESAQAPE
jgi:hypothetical protein